MTMRRKVQLTITLEPDLAEWLDEKVRSKDFHNRTHGIEFCLTRCMELEKERRAPK